jgi:monothiol glutaredoxin
VSLKSTPHIIATFRRKAEVSFHKKRRVTMPLNVNADAVRAAIKRTIDEHEVALFMKGEPSAPECGFSATVVRILNSLGVDFVGVDVLKDPAIRAGIKGFSDWPTVPQLYVRGEFVGGADIVREMFLSGELKSLLIERLLVDA